MSTFHQGVLLAPKEVLKISIRKMSLENKLVKLLPHILGTNQLTKSTLVLEFKQHISSSPLWRHKMETFSCEWLFARGILWSPVDYPLTKG